MRRSTRESAATSTRRCNAQAKLSPANDERDRGVAPPDDARTRALSNDSADSLGVSATHPPDRTVPLPDLPLRGHES